MNANMHILTTNGEKKKIRKNHLIQCYASSSLDDGVNQSNNVTFKDNNKHTWFTFRTWKEAEKLLRHL